MKMASFLNICKSGGHAKQVANPLSDFFANASEKEKESVLKEAAHQANKEQMRVFTMSQVETRTR